MQLDTGETLGKDQATGRGIQEWIFDKDRGRARYIVDGERRPKQRGALMGFVNQTNIWLLLSIFYVLAVAAVCRDCGVWPRVALRVAFAASCWANIFLSDRFHNQDLKLGMGKMNAVTEFRYLTSDLLGNAFVFSAQTLLWAINVYEMCPPELASCVRYTPVLAVAATSTIAYLLASVPPSPETSSTWQVDASMIIMQLQLVTGLHLCYIAALGGLVGVSAIWGTYMLGLSCYGSKKFLDDSNFINYGPHELFHVFVLLGHCSTVVYDLYLLRGDQELGSGSQG